MTISGEFQMSPDLWDDLAGTSEAVPVHDWQREELARRKANLIQNLASGLTWEEVKRRVRGRYGR
jgi:putative addiction module component (TIGR02574 family)